MVMRTLSTPFPQAELPFTEGLEPNARHSIQFSLPAIGCCFSVFVAAISLPWGQQLVQQWVSLGSSFFYHSTLALSSSESPVGRGGFRQCGYVQ